MPRKRFAVRAGTAWESTQESLFGAVAPPTWPKAGAWDLVNAFDTSAPPGPASRKRTQPLSPDPLLPTPRTSDTNGAGVHGEGGLDLRTAVTLLPTPQASDGEKGGPNQRGSSGDLMLPSAVMLIPTPLASDAGPRGGTTGFGLRDWSRSMLLPTPRAQNGEDRNSKIWARPLDQPQNLENALARLTGPDTPPPSNDGNTSPDDEPQPPLF